MTDPKIDLDQKEKEKNKGKCQKQKKTRKESIKWKEKVGDVTYKHKIIRIAYGETCQ